jgi:putative ABC transport system permease protein
MRATDREPPSSCQASEGSRPFCNQFEEPLLLLFGLVGLVVAVGCAAVSGILLARDGARQREIAVRLAIGASRIALVRQVLVEGLLLATLAGLLGLLLSTWTADGLVALLSTRLEPMAVSFTIDSRTLAFATALTCLTVVAFSVAPAAVAARVDPGPTLKLGSHQLAVRRVGRTGSFFVIAQVAFSLLLLVAAALFLRSLVRLLTLDAGFARDNVLVVSADFLSSGDRAEAPPARAARADAAYRELLNRLSREPGVASASLSWVPPISHDLGSWTQSIGIDGAPPLEDGTGYTYFNAVSPRYFETVATTLVAGRDFLWTDDQVAPRVAIVNESLARTFFPGQSPLGRQISVGRHAGRRNLEIVGVVRDARYQSLQEPTRRIAYLPYLQSPELLEGSNLVVEVRSVTNAFGLVRRVGDVVRTVDPSVPVHIETMGDRIRDSLVRERAITLIGAFLALLSLLVAAGALHGLMSDHVARRTNEIGIRLALGARPREISRLVLKETGGLVSVGIVVGLLLAWIGSGIASRFLVGIAPGDPLAVASAVAVVIVVSLVAGALPARRAARVDPLVALRTE